MPIVPLSKVLRTVTQSNSAVGMFNPINIESLNGIICAAEELNQPIMVALADVNWDFYDTKLLMRAIVERAKMSNAPLVLHLDHGHDMELMKEVLDLGFNSIMIDASSQCFEKNVELTSKVVELAAPYHASVEAELGHVGGSEGGSSEEDMIYTDVDEAMRFVALTKVDTLAVAIGTAHGVYKGTPKIDFKRLKQLDQAINIPLVLHGASGLDDTTIKQCIASGIRKVNIFTDLMLAPHHTISKYVNEANSTNYCTISQLAINAIKEKTKEKIKLFENRI